jgi:hypothetical protein
MTHRTISSTRRRIALGWVGEGDCLRGLLRRYLYIKKEK